MKKIHVGLLLSYDYEKMKLSIPAVYKHADRIFLAKDIKSRTWSGNTFSIDPSFYEWLESYDVDQKIEIYEDDFYVPDLTTIDNDTRERQMLAQKMGIGNWIIQVDADEYFVDFEKFVNDLRKLDHYLDNPEKHKVQIGGFWIVIYKYTENGILYVDKPMKAIFATNYPNFVCARRTDERIIYTDAIVLHESLSRDEKELEFKIQNWGHSHQINQEFMDKWRRVNENNYTEFSDFYYIEPSRWKKLGYLPTKDFALLKETVQKNSKLKISVSMVFFKSLGQKIKFLFK